MRMIVRRDDGTDYDEFLEQLAVASGIETPTRADLAKLDRRHPNKGSNKDWKHSHDPEAWITRTKERGNLTYVSEPNRGRRNWKRKRDAQKAVYAILRRIRGNRGKRFLRRRGEKVERAFAHMPETGGLRRVHVRGQEETRKRMLVRAAAFNLGLLIWRRCGFGTPRALQGPSLPRVRAVKTQYLVFPHNPGRLCAASATHKRLPPRVRLSIRPASNV